MITKVSDSNVVLFNKASIKLGLLPFDKEVGVDADGTVITEKWKYYQTQTGEWASQKCEESDFDGENFLIVDKKTGEKVVSHGITSLNEYFRYIDILASFAIGENNRTGSDPYLLRLPADEPFLEINADTRVITVPAELRQVGVIGDELAEVLFFRIDRYFDAVDLNTRDIYIEWEAPGENGEVIKGVSRDFLRDTQSQKDKIIFGWLVGSELTSHTGTIRFSVRFILRNELDIVYSFSTLPAQISVVDTLNYDLFNDKELNNVDTDDQVYTTFKFLLKPADADTGDETAPAEAQAPKIVKDLFNGDKDLVDGKLELVTEAKSEDGGNISYIFGRRTTEDGGTRGLKTSTRYVKATLDGFDANNPENNPVYYEKKNDTTFVIFSDNNIAEAINNGELYEKVAFTTVDKPGYYYAKVYNTVFGCKTSLAETSVTHVPEPAMPVITAPMADKFVLNEDRYALARVEDDIPLDYLGTRMRVIKESVPDTESIVLAPSVAENSNYSYQWYKNEDINSVNLDDLQKERDEQYNDWKTRRDNTLSANGWNPIVGAKNISYTANEPGCYLVVIDNFKNNDFKEAPFLEAGICRVTNMPEMPDILVDKFWTDFAANNNTNPKKVYVTTPNVYDKIEYEWYSVNIDSSKDDVIATNLMDKSTGELLQDSNGYYIPFEPTAEQIFYVVLKTTLNDAYNLVSSAEKTRGQFRVQGINAQQETEGE